MKRTPLNRQAGLHAAKLLKERLLAAGIPVRTLYLYGSVARGQAHEGSDVDIAVICAPFRETRHEENMEVRRIRRDIDVRIEPICLHADDFDKPYFALPHEIRRTGVEV
jgi:predicted nucleotidyltransferase